MFWAKAKFVNFFYAIAQSRPPAPRIPWNPASQKFLAGISGEFLSSRLEFLGISKIQFLADRTNGRALALLVHCCVCRLSTSVVVCNVKYCG